MKDMDVVRFDEKVKRVSTLVGGGGLAFILTALTRWNDKGFELSIGAWILTSILLICVGADERPVGLGGADMTFFDLAAVMLGVGFTGAAYLYLVNERRKLHLARTVRHTPAE